MEKFEEDFEKYIQQFVGVVWNMLTVTGLERRNDALVASGINFLMIVAKSTHHTIFANESILTQICEKIILPNMRLREEPLLPDPDPDPNPIPYRTRIPILPTS